MPEEKKQEDSKKTEEEKAEKTKSSSVKPIPAVSAAVKPAEAKPVAAEKEESADKEVEIPEKFKSLVSGIEKMSVLDLAELVKILEKKFGVSAAAPAIAVAGSADVSNSEQAEEKTSFDVELTEAGANKISVIKAIREVVDIGLKDAKDLVDAAPKMVKEGVKKEEAEEIKKKLEEAGGKVTLK